MNLETIFVYGFVILFLGFILYSTIVIFVSSLQNHKMEKEILDSMSKSERRFTKFLKKIWS